MRRHLAKTPDSTGPKLNSLNGLATVQRRDASKFPRGENPTSAQLFRSSVPYGRARAGSEIPNGRSRRQRCVDFNVGGSRGETLTAASHSETDDETISK